MKTRRTRFVNYQQHFKSCICVLATNVGVSSISKVLLYVNMIYGFDEYIYMLCHVAIIMVHLN